MINASQVQSILGTVGVGMVLSMVDQATEPMRKAQQQSDKLKKSIKDTGDEADRANAKLMRMAQMHQNLQQSSTNLLIAGGAISAAGSAAAGMLGSAIGDVADFQSMLVQTQLEIGKTGKAGYDALNRLALQMATQFNVTTDGATKALYQLGAVYKTIDGIRASYEAAGALANISQGFMDFGQSAQTLSTWTSIFNPNMNYNSPSQIKKLTQQSVANMAYFGAQTSIRPDQFLQFAEGIAPTTAGRAKFLQTPEQQLAFQQQTLAAGSLAMRLFPGEPRYAAELVGFMGHVYANPNSARMMGVNPYSRDKNGNAQMVPMSDILQQMISSKVMGPVLSGKLDPGNPIAASVEATLGGPYLSQIISKLASNPQNMKEYLNILKGFQDLNSKKFIDDYLKNIQSTLKYWMSMAQTTMSVFKELFIGPLLPGLTFAFKTVSQYLAKFVDFLQSHEEIKSWASYVGAATTSLILFGAAVKVGGIALALMDTYLGFSVIKIAAIAAGFGAFGVLSSAVLYGFTTNIVNIRKVMTDWVGGIGHPLEQMKLTIETIGQLLLTPHNISKKMWIDDLHAGIGGMVESIAQLQYKMEDLFDGVKKGFHDGFGPFLKAFEGNFNQGGVSKYINDLIANFGYLLDSMSKKDWEHVGEVLGKTLGNLATNIATGLTAAAKAFSEAFKVVQQTFQWLKGNPELAAIIGRVIGGPVGLGIQGLAAATLFQRGDIDPQKHPTRAYVESFLFAPGIRDPLQAYGAYKGFTSGDFGSQVNSVTTALILASKYLPGLRSVVGGGAGPNGIQGGSDMAINANNVYINSANVGSGGPGGGGSGPDIPTPMNGGIGGWIGRRIGGPIGAAAGLIGTLGSVGMASSVLGNIFKLIAAGGQRPGLDRIGDILKTTGNVLNTPFNWVKSGLINSGKFVIGGGLLETVRFGIVGILAGLLGAVVTWFTDRLHETPPGKAIDNFINNIMESLGSKVDDYFHKLDPNYFKAGIGNDNKRVGDSPLGLFGSINPGGVNMRGLGGYQKSSILRAASTYRIDPRLIYGEFYAESSLGKANPNADPFTQMGLIAGPGHYGGYGYRGTGQNTYDEAFMTNAAMWADSIAEMKAKGLPTDLMSVIKYHEASYTPIGAANDPNGLNANKIRNTIAGINLATSALEPSSNYMYKKALINGLRVTDSSTMDRIEKLVEAHHQTAADMKRGYEILHEKGSPDIKVYVGNEEVAHKVEHVVRKKQKVQQKHASGHDMANYGHYRPGAFA